MVEHIFFDLDGTLIGSSGAVRPSVWAAIEPLRGRIGMSVCTGRPRAGIAREVARRLDPAGLHIFENGGMVAAVDDHPVFMSALDPVDLLITAEAAKRIDATVELYTTDGVYVSRLDHDTCAHAAAIGIDVEEADLSKIIDVIPVIRAHWIMRAGAVDEVLAIELSQAEIGVASSPVLPGLWFGSVTRRGTSKASAAARLASRGCFSLADAAAVGDADGDLGLLEDVGHPFVVANATAELLERFDVLGHVDGRGVEPLLEALASP